MKLNKNLVYSAYLLFSKRLSLDFPKEESSATCRFSYLKLRKIQLFLKCKYRKTPTVATPADNKNQLFIWFNAVYKEYYK